MRRNLRSQKLVKHSNKRRTKEPSPRLMDPLLMRVIQAVTKRKPRAPKTLTQKLRKVLSPTRKLRELKKRRRIPKDAG